MRGLPASVKPVRQVQDDGELCQLGRLEADPWQEDPAPRAGHFRPDPRDQHGDQQGHRPEIGRDGKVAEPAKVHAARDEHGAQADARPDELLHAIRGRIVVGEIRADR